jgi:hypothetical protein
MLKLQYSSAFKAQAFHALLCIIWNGAAMWQVQSGEQPIGPSASGMVIISAVSLVALLALCLHRNWEAIYLILSLMAFGVAASAIYGGFTKNPELWPSQTWRIVGIVVNMVGVTGFILVLHAFVGGSRKTV